MTMTLRIEDDDTLFGIAGHQNNHLVIIRALLEACSMLLRGASPPPVSGGAHETPFVDDDDAITWGDAEWQ
jgi:hypothetical protein